MIYLFDKDEKLIKIVRKSAVKTALQKYALTTERYVSDRLTVELKGLNADELEQVEYMAIQTMEDAHTFHYFYVAQKFSDSLTTLIGVQSGIEELRKSPVYDKRPKNAFARDVITDLLAGTNWQARFVGETTPHSTNFYYTSIFDALKKVCEVWDLEMQFFVEMNGNRIGARYIDFKQRIGEAIGKRVVYGHNALQILQEVERTNIFTALVGRGKGEETGDGYGRKITFEDVVWSRTQGKPVDKPKGQKYLELPLMTRQYGIKNADGSMRPKIGFVDFSEEENPEVLIERTYRALVDSARPQLTLKTSSVYLKGVKIGDTIRVVRHDKKLDYDTRIFEITFNRLNNQSSDIKLGDRIGESNEAKVQTIADKAVEQFVNNEFSNFVQNLPDYLPSADGFNNNWYGAEDPTVKYPGKVLINDIWYKPDPEHEGHKIMLRWTGEVWEEILRTYESEALRDRIAEEIAQVNTTMQAQSEEHDRQVADILSKTQSIESLANQAKTDAASALARANQVKTEAIADARAQVATVSQAFYTAKTELQSAIASADQKARDSQASATALRNDLNLQASKILEQARAQTALTNRVTTVETLADGTRSTVAELSRTMQEATQNIASVTARTKTVEDTLSQTRTQYEALTQTVNAQTGQIDSINRRTGTIEVGLTGIQERFESIKIGNRNYFKNAKDRSYLITNAVTQDFRTYIYEDFWKNTLRFERNKVRVSFDIAFSPALPQNFTTRVHFEATPWYSSSVTFKGNTTDVQHIDLIIDLSSSNASYWADNVFIRFSNSFPVNTNVSIKNMMLYISDFKEDYAEPSEDFRSEFATYVRNATENSAELVRRIETADGKAVDAKSYAQQTAEGFKSRIESLETYKDAEGTRASQYLTASRTETAKQIAAERTAIATDYVAKSTYTEDVRGTTLKLNEIKSTADTAKQNLATYQETVDRKLTELTSSTQTLDGKIDAASAKVDTVAGQIRTELTRVEGKIPSDLGGRNYILKSDVYATSGSRYFDTSPEFIDYAYSGKYVTISLDIKGENLVPDSRGLSRIGCELRLNLSDGKVLYLQCQKIVSGTQPRERISVTRKIPEGVSVVSANKVNMYIQVGGTALAGRPKFELSSIPSDWSPAPEDINSELNSTKTLITQTAEGQTQLSNRLTTTQDKVSTAETKINQLIGDVSSKVSQTDYNTLTGRVSSAETAITQNAQEISKRLTSTQVNQAILADKKIKDTRSDNQSPQWYWTNYPRQTVEEFKRSTVIGLIGESAYAILTTNVQWDDSSGGKVKQTAKTDRATFERYGAGTTWEEWTKIANAGDLANYTTKTEFQTVKETTSLYERIIGSTETGIKDKVARMVMADSLFLTEVKDKISGTATRVSQLAGSYAIKNLTKAGDVLGQINLNPDGSVRINEGLISIGDKTYIKNGVIKSAMIGKGQIGTAHIGEIDAGIAKIINLDVSNIKGLDAEFIKAKIENALIGWLRGKTISAVNNVTTFDLTTGLITVNNNQSGFLFKDGNSVVGRFGYGNITRLGIGLSKGIDIYTNKNHSLALGYEMTNGMYSTAIQVDGGSGEVRIASPIYLSDKIYPLATKSYGYLRLDPFGNSGLKLTRNSGNGIAFDDTDVYIIVNGNTYSFKQWIINRR
ncbi:phage tail spike protein [Streptococcus iners]|uniref:Phage tail protein n=1 Tax=Streptococcus iners TaxID=3028084 RepID=A0AA96VN06_9STRE|nr:phage tail spike protein [Streptococcus sp. 29887]WNY51541.1 phage tail protein [Streptococcus sp. 29887]